MAGRPLVVELHNKGFTAHTFTIDAPHVDVVGDRGHDQTVTIELPSQPGRLPFCCRFHAGEGMRGQITYRLEGAPLGGVSGRRRGRVCHR
jgi:plastocyanin